MTMKKKLCLKKRYWGYCFTCNKENEEEIENRLIKYTLGQDEITHEHWALNTNYTCNFIVNIYGATYFE
ncbi:hypothetical protein SKUN_00939 [Spiroplasma kunkelii CR2-3x]|uniref:Uncharacterized protein n=1 Tax=Spiroplasma kunkelii CR2-3x TaxID=273035 RepID=A0A0K2JHY1_SPIKU|nr:hypothetical protein [Spiroplasma kunkelii]ALA97826.1 hypothetical protein SKUN_00939 [Spiroplasma kunkelii CR2-3x]